MTRARRTAALLLALALVVLAPAVPSSAQGATEVGRITASVVGPGHVALPGIEVYVGRFDPESTGGLVLQASTRTGLDGTVDVDVPAGAYVLDLVDRSGTYESVRYPQGDLIRVGGGQAVAVEVEMSPGIRATTPPTVSGTPRRGSSLVVDPGVWEPAVTLTVQWYAGKPIPGATSTTLKLTGRTYRAAAGKHVSVRVTATAPDHDPVSVLVRVPGKVRR